MRGGQASRRCLRAAERCMSCHAIQGRTRRLSHLHWKVIPPCDLVLWQQASLPTSSLAGRTLSQPPAAYPHNQPCLPCGAWGSCPTWSHVLVGFAWQGHGLALGMLHREVTDSHPVTGRCHCSLWPEPMQDAGAPAWVGAAVMDKPSSLSAVLGFHGT